MKQVDKEYVDQELRSIARTWKWEARAWTLGRLCGDTLARVMVLATVVLLVASEVWTFLWFVRGIQNLIGKITG